MCPTTSAGKIIRLLILTMCRRDEIGSLTWSEIDKEGRLIRFPGARTKNGQEHIVPLSSPAMAIIDAVDRRKDRDLLFGSGNGGYSGWSKSKERLDKLVPIKAPWVLHDLRRSGRTGSGILGVAPHIAEAVLNHLPPKLMRTYDRNKYEKEKREALEPLGRPPDAPRERQTEQGNSDEERDSGISRDKRPAKVLATPRRA